MAIKWGSYSTNRFQLQREKRVKITKKILSSFHETSLPKRKEKKELNFYKIANSNGIQKLEIR